MSGPLGHGPKATGGNLERSHLSPSRRLASLVSTTVAHPPQGPHDPGALVTVQSRSALHLLPTNCGARFSGRGRFDGRMVTTAGAGRASAFGTSPRPMHSTRAGKQVNIRGGYLLRREQPGGGEVLVDGRGRGARPAPVPVRPSPPRCPSWRTTATTAATSGTLVLFRSSCATLVDVPPKLRYPTLEQAASVLGRLGTAAALGGAALLCLAACDQAIAAERPPPRDAGLKPARRAPPDAGTPLDAGDAGFRPTPADFMSGDQS